MMNSDMESVWKRSQHCVIHCHGIGLDGLRKTTDIQ
jgi:hypothetical protein